MTGRYGVILADPPWSFSLWSAKGAAKSAQAHYACLSADQISALPVRDMAAPDCLLFLWATWPMLPVAMRAMEAWGFAYKTGGAWAKQSRSGRKWAFGTGYLFRGASEPFLIGTVGRPKQAVRDVRNLIVAPVREHSRKPDDAHRILERMFPDVPKAELFARQRREGWDVFGNEVDKFTEAA